MPIQTKSGRAQSHGQQPPIRTNSNPKKEKTKTKDAYQLIQEQ